MAKLFVVTTLPSFADLAQNVGGPDLTVVSLTRGTQDPHFVDAKPDLILSLNRADLLIHAGLGLEDGWLPPLVTGARNGKIQLGSDGNFDASTVISLKEVSTSPIDRSMGDVHPGGNPHYMLDPRNAKIVAKAIAERLSKIDPSNAANYEKRRVAFTDELQKKIRNWEDSLKKIAGTKIVTYHKSWIYFADWIGLKEVGYIEPKPGIPPSPDHIVKLIALMKDKKAKYIFIETYYPKGSAEEIAKATSSKLLVLPTEVFADPEVKTYFALFEELVSKLSKGL